MLQLPTFIDFEPVQIYLWVGEAKRFFIVLTTKTVLSKTFQKYSTSVLYGIKNSEKIPKIATLVRKSQN